jgi:hypothetical protein
MTSEAFMALAQSLLSEQDAQMLAMVSLDPQPLPAAGSGPSYADKAPASGSAFIDDWREWERTLRLNIARHRFIKIKRDGAVQADPPAIPVDAAGAAARAVTATESPLEVEIMLDKARWNAIEALQGTDYFSCNTVFAYLLKLLILERRALFQTETGFSEYKSLYASILDSAQLSVIPAGEFK